MEYTGQNQGRQEETHHLSISYVLEWLCFDVYVPSCVATKEMGTQITPESTH